MVCFIKLKHFDTFLYSLKDDFNFDNFTTDRLCWKAISCEIMTHAKNMTSVTEWHKCTKPKLWSWKKNYKQMVQYTKYGWNPSFMIIYAWLKYAEPIY